jgi:hypothetical protein
MLSCMMVYIVGHAIGMWRVSHALHMPIIFTMHNIVLSTRDGSMTYYMLVESNLDSKILCKSTNGKTTQFFDNSPWVVVSPKMVVRCK